jgi:hypothetical protein
MDDVQKMMHDMEQALQAEKLRKLPPKKRLKRSNSLAFAEENVNLDNIGTFDPSTICRCPLILVFGARRVGKTQLMSWLLKFMKPDIDEAYLFSKTADLQFAAWDMIVDQHRYVGFRDDIIESLWRKQIDRMTELNDQLETTYPDKRLRQEKVKAKVPCLHLIFDDIISDERIRNTEIINRIFTMGRHANVGATFLSQSVSPKASFNNMCRPNVDYVFSSHMNSMGDWERLAQHYVSFEDWKTGLALSKAITRQKYRFVVAKHCLLDTDNPVRTNETNVFMVKAPAKLPRFRLGDPDLWRLQDLQYRRNLKRRAAKSSSTQQWARKFVMPAGGHLTETAVPELVPTEDLLDGIKPLRGAFHKKSTCDIECDRLI